MIRFDCWLSRAGFRFEVAFEAGDGVTALFGPSGSGKSTAIGLLAGLKRCERGVIEVAGKTLLDTARGVFTPAHRRRVGLVFQDALLLPHLSVRGNLRYGLRFTPRAERRIGEAAVVEMLGIGHLLDRRPATLSGGERQRVAIGRALLASPRLLLMDEPLASLDAPRRREILPFVERLRDEFAIPIVYVSHAVEEVTRLARTVVRLENGRVLGVGPPGAVLGPSLDAPADRFAAVSLLAARPKRYLEAHAVTILDHPAGEIVAPVKLTGQAPVRLAVRATDVTIARGGAEALSVRTALSGVIAAIERDAGPFVVVTIALTGGDVLKAFITRLAADALSLEPGLPVTALLKAVALDEEALGPAAP
jgi:molybdate transport system ATP-binding protein